MSRNKTKFAKDLSELFSKAQLESQKAALETKVSETDSFEEAAKKISIAASKAFEKELFPKLADIFDEYLESIEYDFSAVSSPAGPVTGKLKLLP
jgi:hypothetical protein